MFLYEGIKMALPNWLHRCVLEFDRVAVSSFFLCSKAQTRSNFPTANSFTTDSPVMGPLLLTMSHRVRLDGDKSSSAPELAHTSFQEPVAKVWGILQFQAVEQSLLKIKS